MVSLIFEGASPEATNLQDLEILRHDSPSLGFHIGHLLCNRLVRFLLRLLKSVVLERYQHAQGLHRSPETYVSVMPIG